MVGMSIHSSVLRIRAYRQSAKLSRRGLATAAGLGVNTLRDIDSPDWSPVLRTIEQIEAIIPEDFQIARVAV